MRKFTFFFSENKELGAFCALCGNLNTSYCKKISYNYVVKERQNKFQIIVNFFIYDLISLNNYSTQQTCFDMNKIGCFLYTKKHSYS